MRKELPLKHIKEPKKFTRQGVECVTFIFKPKKGKEYFYKEIRSFVLCEYPGKALEEKANSMKFVYDILKKHYGDKIIDTHFIVAKNEEGEPCIIKVQKRAIGDPAGEIFEHREPSRHNKAYQQVQEMQKDLFKVMKKIMKDSRFANLEVEDVEDLIFDIGHSGNVVVDKKGNIKIVDW